MAVPAGRRAWKGTSVIQERQRTVGKGPGRRARYRLLGFLALLSVSLLSLATVAQDLQFFRVGTGSSAGTYFPIGGIIASAVSNPPGSRECSRGGNCGVPGLIAIAQSTHGSVANVNAIANGTLESGFSQADVAYWAYNGTGIFEEEGPVEDIRAIANLYPESIHLVVRRGSGIRKVADLAGKRISIDRKGSGTRVDAQLILAAYGLEPDDLEAVSLSVGAASDKLRAGELDGFFFIVGTPANAVSQLARDNLISLVPISGPESEALRDAYPFFASDSISSGTYLNVPQTQTLSVGAQWLVSADVPEELVFQITKALWHDTTRRLLDTGHPKGKLIRPETALNGIGIPLHPGAERYYEEAGLIPLGEGASPTQAD